MYWKCWLKTQLGFCYLSFFTQGCVFFPPKNAYQTYTDTKEEGKSRRKASMHRKTFSLPLREIPTIPELSVVYKGIFRFLQYTLVVKKSTFVVVCIFGSQ
jgi:hypothetical protein